MKNTLILIGVGLLLLVAGFYTFNSFIHNEKQVSQSINTNSSYRDIKYIIEGESMMIGNQLQFFGNELVTDINDDGRDDVVFLVTYTPGGSGTFFYAVAALKTDTGYVGSDGYLLGDRIAPQTIELSQNPNHNNVIVINYADRKVDESMVTPPSMGKSVYLKLDTDAMQWGIVEPDFSGEADPRAMSLTMKPWVWQQALYNDGREIRPLRPDLFTITFMSDKTVSVGTDCNSAGANYELNDNQITFSSFRSTMMYCENSQEAEFLKLLENTQSYHFSNRGELILDLKFDSGTVMFR